MSQNFDPKQWKKFRLGTMIDGEYGPAIFLGNLKNKDPKFNYTVKLAIFDNDGNLVKKFENPKIKLKKPENLKEGSKIKYDLSISVKNQE